MKILIVDDNPDDRKLLRYMVEKNGHQAIEAEHGADGLQKAGSNLPDLIISDALMPVMDGFQFLREVKQDQNLRAIPFIFHSSSYVESQDVRLAESLGADAYYIKPVDPVELWGKISALLAAGKKAPAPAPPLVEEDTEYLKQYSQVVATKLEKKVRELEQTLLDRQRAEQALKDSEERYRTLFEGVPDAILIADLETGCIYDANPSAARLLGRSCQELIGLQQAELHPPGILARTQVSFQEHAAAARAGNISGPFEHLVLRADGSEVPVEIMTQPVVVNGKLMMQGVFRDISARKQAELSLRASEQAFRAVVENSPDVIIRYDREGRRIYVNPEFERVNHLTAQQVLGKKPLELATELAPVADVFTEKLMAAMASGVVTKIDLAWNKEGRLVSWFVRVVPEFDEAGQVISALTIWSDLTERKHLEEQLFHAQKMEAIGRLAGGIAHDFNNILNVVIGYGNLMELGLQEGDLSLTYLREIIAAAQRAAHLTQGLLIFSRKQAVDLKPIDINALVNGMRKMLPRIIGEDIETVIQTSDLPLTVQADYGQIEQVLMNFATNARDAMPNGGKLTIKTLAVEMDEAFIHAHGYGSPGHYVCIEVTDTGQGMDEATRDRIFEPFFTTKEVGKGTGLGLSIVFGIVKQHKGYVNCYSEPGRGTSFSVYLPRLAVLSREEMQINLVPIPGGHETILLAEDDAALRKFSQDLLEMYGYRVLAAVDGEEAVAKFKEHMGQIHLVLLDMIMPRKNGNEVYEEIHALRPEVKVIFVSGYPDHAIQRQRIVEAKLELIQKPFSTRELLEAIRACLDRQG